MIPRRSRVVVFIAAERFDIYVSKVDGKITHCPYWPPVYTAAVSHNAMHLFVFVLLVLHSWWGGGDNCHCQVETCRLSVKWLPDTNHFALVFQSKGKKSLPVINPSLLKNMFIYSQKNDVP